jgi:hypothetical protein
MQTNASSPAAEAAYRRFMSQGVGNSRRFLGKPYNAATCEFDAMQTTVLIEGDRTFTAP